MEPVDRVKIGDLRALIMFHQGMPLTSIAALYGTSFVNIRDRLKRLESAIGAPIYVHRDRPSSNMAEITKEGELLAQYAAEVVEIFDGGIDMVSRYGK